MESLSGWGVSWVGLRDRWGGGSWHRAWGVVIVGTSEGRGGGGTYMPVKAKAVKAL